jgi:hypothetical protein
METTTTSAAALEPRQIDSHRGSHAPAVGRDVHARLAGSRPNQDVDLPPFWGEDGFTFDDIVDLVNPLHHIPLVGSLYRSLTGDQIAAGPRIMGGALFAGGPVGAAIAAAGNAVNAGIAHDTGNDIGGHALAWLGIGDNGPDTPSPSPAPRPVELAELNDLPWLKPASITDANANPAPQDVLIEAPSPAIETVAYVAPASQPSPRVSAPTTVAEDRTNLSDHQWEMLVASLEPQEVARADRHAAAAVTTAEPAQTSVQQPADVAAVMVRALDKYEALTRARTLDELAE